MFGQNASVSKIPATVPDDKNNRFTPKEKESICVTFKLHSTNPNRFDSAYLPLGNATGTPQFLTFDVYARASGLKKRNNFSWTTLRFAFDGKICSER